MMANEITQRTVIQFLTYREPPQIVFPVFADDWLTGFESQR